jgi:DNA-binding Lrp family transcriptional regulator
MTMECCPEYVRPATSEALQSLRERDRQILLELAKGDDSQVAFQGLRRRLDLHPQALQRSLKRLESDGFVRRDAFGYGLSEQGLALFQGEGAAVARPRGVPLVTGLLPAHVEPAHVVERLGKRWFEGLGWDGLSQGPGETVLNWRRKDGGEIRLRLTHGGFRIEVASASGLDPAAVADAGHVLSALGGIYLDQPAS